MNIIASILYDKGGIAIATDHDLQELRNEAYDRCHQEAERRNIYYSHALANLDLYREFEPTPDGVREYLGDEQLGDWRACMVMAATLAIIGHLEAEVEADLSKVEAAIQEASVAGYEPTKLYATCAHGWAPHQADKDWTNGTLYQWQRLDGGVDAAMLRVSLSEDAEAWIDLRRVD